MTLPTNALNLVDQTLHSLSQLLALTAMQWLPPRPDDSQTNMLWNSDQHWLEGRPFTYNGHQLRLVIDTATFTLQFVDEGERVLAAFPPQNRTPADATTWWQSQMQAWGVADIKGVNYRLDHEPIALHGLYEWPKELDAWIRWRTTANEVLMALNEWSGRASEIRIWPHHFDTGVYYAQTDADGHETAAIWAGYATADSLCNEPYFYISGYRRGEPIHFTTAPTLSMGEWRNTPNWKGALLPISGADEEAHINQFFQESYRWLKQKTSNPLAY